MIELLPIMPTTWSVSTSCLASEAICDGLVASVTGKNLIGWPLTPPLAFTQAKYAPVMFSMSLKSVTDCLVLIAPMLIGVPVAAVPGVGPQDEAETVPPAAALLELELDELELQAARKPSVSSAAAAAVVRVRQWTGLFMCSAFGWLTARDYPSERER